MMRPINIGVRDHESLLLLLLLQQRPKRPTQTTRTTRIITTRLSQPTSRRILFRLSICMVLLLSSVLFHHNGFVFITPTLTVTALPNGAPVCTVGEAAPQVKHLEISRNPRQGKLIEGGFYIQIGTTILTDTTTTIYEYNAHEDISVIVTSETGGQPFKGVLIVMSRVSADLGANLFLKNDGQLQFLKQAQCDAGRVAVTHWNNQTKTAVEATMNFDENYDVVLVDVNIVIVNNAKASIFYYDQYKIRITGATQYPTPVPVITCGLFGRSFFCLPKITFCGFLGRLFGQDQRDCVKKNQFFSLSY